MHPKPTLNPKEKQSITEMPHSSNISNTTLQCAPHGYARIVIYAKHSVGPCFLQQCFSQEAKLHFFIQPRLVKFAFAKWVSSLHILSWEKWRGFLGRLLWFILWRSLALPSWAVNNPIYTSSGWAVGCSDEVPTELLQYVALKDHKIQEFKGYYWEQSFELIFLMVFNDLFKEM